MARQARPPAAGRQVLFCVPAGGTLGPRGGRGRPGGRGGGAGGSRAGGRRSPFWVPAPVRGKIVPCIITTSSRAVRAATWPGGVNHAKPGGNPVRLAGLGPRFHLRGRER